MDEQREMVLRASHDDIRMHVHLTQVCVSDIFSKSLKKEKYGKTLTIGAPLLSSRKRKTSTANVITIPVKRITDQYPVNQKQGQTENKPEVCFYRFFYASIKPITTFE